MGKLNSLTHQKCWLLNKTGQIWHHHSEVMFTEADNAFLDVICAFMVLLGVRWFKWKLQGRNEFWNAHEHLEAIWAKSQEKIVPLWYSNCSNQTATLAITKRVRSRNLTEVVFQVTFFCYVISRNFAMSTRRKNVRIHQFLAQKLRTWWPFIQTPM